MTIIEINSGQMRKMVDASGKGEILEEDEVKHWLNQGQMPSRMVKDICKVTGLEAYPNLDRITRPVWGFRKKEWPEQTPDLYLREQCEIYRKSA